FLTPSGDARIYRYEGDPETFALDPTRIATAARFIEDGAVHFFDQSDYLLLALCIALVFQNLKSLFPFAALLAAAQAMALFVALGVMSTEFWLRGLCGTAIVGAIVYMGCEAIIAAPSRRIVLALVVGALFGYGFWLGLEPTVQFGGAHLAAAAVGFIVGVIAAEAVTLVACAGAVYALTRFSSASQRLVIVIAAFAIHIAWRRFLDRADALALMPSELRGIESTILLYAGAVMIALFAAHALLTRAKQSRV
ncbi:MAG TPA: hypothetical protein VK629_19285, partial [Steroidobacteraceae bacterium]|nr:hypothetical protein [Steroidobacteraceae bacterium]